MPFFKKKKKIYIYIYKIVFTLKSKATFTTFSKQIHKWQVVFCSNTSSPQKWIRLV